MDHAKRRIRLRRRCPLSFNFSFAYVLLLFGASRIHVHAYCPPTDSAIAQDNFYKCTRNMDKADVDEDDLLDPEEFEIYIKSMVFSLFVVPPFPLREALPSELSQDLYSTLVNISGNVVDENGDPSIDVYGSNVYELPLIDRERMDELKEICWASVAALNEFTPKTASPKMLVMESVVAQNDESERTDSDDQDEFMDVLSIHSSFVLANYENLEAHHLHVAYDSAISRAYQEFLYDLLATECPTHDKYKHCWDDPYASYDDALEKDGSLCGSHTEWVRRIFCGSLRHRDLEGKPDHQIESVVLYRVQESRCPIPMIHPGTGGGYAPRCQTVYAHYLMHLHDLDVAHKAEIEEVYVNITEAAIDNGMLEDALLKVDPDSVYVVEGAGPRVRPTVHKHHLNPFHQRRYLTDSCRRQLVKQMRAWERKPPKQRIEWEEDWVEEGEWI